MSEDLLDKNSLENLRGQIAVLKSQCLANAVPPVILQQVDDLESMLERVLEKADEGIGMTAQVSIYPLRQATLSPVIDKALSLFRKQGLEVKPGTMSTLIAGTEGAIWKALRNAFLIATAQGGTVMIVTVSNACPMPSPNNYKT